MKIIFNEIEIKKFMEDLVETLFRDKGFTMEEVEKIKEAFYDALNK